MSNPTPRPQLLQLGWDDRFAVHLESEAAGLEPGRVVAEDRGHYLVAWEGGEGSASPSGRLRYETTMDPKLAWPAVGDWAALERHLERSAARPLADRLRLFTARGGSSLFETAFAPDDVLVFGSESRGLPPVLVARFPSQRVYVPIRAEVRSLNLANVVCLATYTALVRAGLPLPDNDGRYVADARAHEDVRPLERALRVDG